MLNLPLVSTQTKRKNTAVFISVYKHNTNISSVNYNRILITWLHVSAVTTAIISPMYNPD